MSGCSDVCLDMDSDCIYNDFYVESMRRARKPHTCCECRRVIHPREMYQHVTGKSDGDVWTNKSCLECQEIRKTFVCGSWIFGQLWEEIEQVMFPIWEEQGPIDCLAKVESLAARDKLRAAYAVWKE